MRCNPCTRMLLTVNSSLPTCCASRAHGAMAKSRVAASARASARRLPMIKDASTELSRNVVEQGHAHQQHQQRDAELLTDGLEAFRQRAALEPLDGLKHDLPAVENRD